MISRAVRLWGIALWLGAIGLVLTGCWDMRSASQYVIVSSMSVTTGEHANYHVYLQVINSLEFTSSKGKGNAPTLTFDAEGNTMDEVFSRIEQKTSRELELSHMMLLIMDSKLLATDHGLLFIEFLETMKDIRNDIQLVAAHKVPASEFAKLYFPDTQVSAVKIRFAIDSVDNNWGESPDTTLKQFIGDITSEGRQPVMSSITIDQPSKKSHTVEVGKSVDTQTEIVTDGTAVLRRGRLIGFLDTEETRNMKWVEDKIKHTSLSIPCQKEHFVQVRIDRSKTRLNVEYANNRPKVTIQIDVDGKISENQCSTIRLSKLSGYDQVRKLTEKEIKSQVEETIAKVQKNYGVDIFGFGEQLKRNHYQTFKKVRSHWDDEFVKADVTVKVKAEIFRDGMTSDNFLQDIPGYTQ
ncbi:germination protein GerKC [Paenibacillus sp. CCS19]|uniref:Ger(x)C family spore germination protein n=1 Tax=Paenibacillus sp. CCS19 TaxID=3158387 RepID=UPI00256220B3|nr:Ger(x)C family spore germination protein [Paenibacillus cellulosilyticus]GMK38066.1 germination protein GerKC [Paenibacillus cellulosilyticus]